MVEYRELGSRLRESAGEEGVAAVGADPLFELAVEIVACGCCRTRCAFAAGILGPLAADQAARGFAR